MPDAPADPEALAAVLRAAGWICVAPSRDALPELAVGQVWEVPAEWREIVEMEPLGWVRFPRSGQCSLSVTSRAFLAWARRTGAKVRS